MKQDSEKKLNWLKKELTQKQKDKILKRQQKKEQSDKRKLK
jgi:hypothetical protein